MKNTEILIVDTDYNSYAILLYKRRDKRTLKLYGMSQSFSYIHFLTQDWSGGSSEYILVQYDEWIMTLIKPSVC